MSGSTTATADVPLNSDIDDDPESGLELEQDDPTEQITHPFDPEQISIHTQNIVVEQLVSRIRFKEIDLAPDFQRLRGIWNAERRSRLIESLLLRIPIPVFYVAADVHEHWSVVDGVQRMSTIYEYVTGEFALQKLEYLTWLDGSWHNELPRRMQRRISETQLIINVIQPGTPAEVMFNIFLRINTGGMTLNGQEIRHALHPGPARGYLEELAKSDQFARATDSSISPTRMADRECVLRFLAFHINPWEKYAANDLDGYLGSVMDEINKMDSSKRTALAADFNKAMHAAFEVFGDNAFRKPRAEDNRRRPVNRALFESWSVQLARCSAEQIDLLIKQREQVQSQFERLMKEDQDFDRSVSYATGGPKRVQKRFRAVEQLVEEFV